jgi:hypothetical protein
MFIITAIPIEDLDVGVKLIPIAVGKHTCNCHEIDPIKYAKKHGLAGPDLAILELPIDQYSAELLGTDKIVCMGIGTGKGPTLAVGHSIMYDGVLFCRKFNGKYCGFKDTYYYQHIINYYLSIWWMVQGHENAAPEPVAMGPLDMFDDMIKKAFDNGME